MDPSLRLMTHDTEQQVPSVLLEPPVSGTEVDTLIGSLERQRRTFAWKCEGLDAGGLGARLAPSVLTLGGLLKHLALVEDEYFTRRLLGVDLPPPWDTVDWDADPDWEWRSAAADEPERLYALWQGAVARSRANLRKALSAGGVDQPARLTWPDGRAPSVRRILIDLVEEYARHVGQADMIRESIDGRVGEDPPADFPVP
ncbi:mini-circle protein [Streptomyces chartreusis]|nr:mini-circle protein [Streptomyces chartreusis]